jgi:hypothetical protein
MDLKHKIREQGVSQYYVRVPTLSVAQLWQRERHRSQNGDLQQGEVIVCDTQPLVLEELAVQIRVNMDHAINYTYFLYFSVDTIEKICQALQVILVAGVAPKQATDFHANMSIIKERRSRLDDLRSICRDRRLRIGLMPKNPNSAFAFTARQPATGYGLCRNGGGVSFRGLRARVPRPSGTTSQHFSREGTVCAEEVWSR